MTTASQSEEPRSSAYGARNPWGFMTGRGDQVSEQMLGLADQLGAAFAEAYERISAAYAEAYQKMTLEIGGLQETFADQQGPNWQAAMISPNDYLTDAKDWTVGIGENLTDMSVRIGLAYLEAFEQATLVAAKCHEQIAESSHSDFLKSTAAARAELARRIAQAGASTIRDILS
jgi:hypothetical protein